MDAQTATPAETFAQDVNRDIASKISDSRWQLQRTIEATWRKLVEEFDEQTAMQTVINGIVREATMRADEAGSWNRQQLGEVIAVLETAADELGRL